MDPNEALIIKAEGNFDEKKEIPSTGRKSHYPQSDIIMKDKYREDMEYLRNKGYEQKMIEKVYILLKPKTKEQAESLMTPVDGIYSHKFYVSKRSSNHLCVICGKTENFHKNKKINRTSLVGGLFTNARKSIQNTNLDVSLPEIGNNNEHICSICDAEISTTEYETNKLECNHLCCDECWYKYLCGRINEAKVSSIKCFSYKCETELSEEFIFDKIKQNESMIAKYKEFKFKSDIMKSSNKKFCPYPGCNSFIERNEGDSKYVQCEKGHKSCYVCLKEWHGKTECEEELEKDFQIWKQGKVIKRCPRCHFYTEKNKGCNHMTCAECEYQWCWLCEREYKKNHYEKGQCNGMQFVEADSVEEANETGRMSLYDNDGNYCCRCCCIEQCAETNWDYDFTSAYIALVALFVIGIPIAVGLAPLTVPIGVCIGGVSIGMSIYEFDETKGIIKCLFYLLNGLTNICIGIYCMGIGICVTMALWALVMVCPCTNPFFFAWFYLKGLEDSFQDYDDLY